MDNFQIETAQNININQNAAGIGERLLAWLIDFGVIVIYIIIAIVLVSSFANTLPDDTIFIISITITLPIIVYHLLFEMFWDGKSLGKHIMKLKVVKLDGSKPSFSNYLLRWLLRIIDITITSGGLAVVTILFNGRGQRLGDLAGATTVISTNPKEFLHKTLFTQLPDDFTPTYPQVTIFSDQEIQTAKRIFQESRYSSNHNMIIKLADKLAAVMEVEIDGTPIKFVDTVISDYNYYTQQM